MDHSDQEAPAPNKKPRLEGPWTHSVQLTASAEYSPQSILANCLSSITVQQRPCEQTDLAKSEELHTSMCGSIRGWPVSASNSSHTTLQPQAFSSRSSAFSVPTHSATTVPNTAARANLPEDYTFHSSCSAQTISASVPIPVTQACTPADSARQRTPHPPGNILCQINPFADAADVPFPAQPCPPTWPEGLSYRSTTPEPNSAWQAELSNTFAAAKACCLSSLSGMSSAPAPMRAQQTPQLTSMEELVAMFVSMQNAVHFGRDEMRVIGLY